jgi:hypothetical protein
MVCQRGRVMSAQHTIRIGLAVIGSVVSFLLSWPYWRDFGYWAESRTMWLVYFAVGFCLAIYVFKVFLRSLATLFEHDALERVSVVDASAPLVTDEEARS